MKLKFKEAIICCFEITDLSLMLRRMTKLLFSKKKYLQYILKETKMWNLKSILTLVKEKLKLVKEVKGRIGK